MKRELLLLCLPVLLLGDFEVSGHLDLDSQAYLTSPDTKHENSFTLKQTLEFKYENDALTAFAKVYAQEDYYDLSSDESEHNDRTFARLDELFLKYDFDESALQAGKDIKFWGALELQNIVDGFNPNELRDDMFKVNKLGVWNASYSYYTDSGEVSAIVKLYEQDQSMASAPYVYYLFPDFVSYDDDLVTSDGAYQPSLYLLYSGSTDTEYALDFSFIYEHGYDSQRYFSAPAPQAPTEFVANAYIVDKFMTYNTLVVDSTLIKLEALYAKVSDDDFVGDYAHIAFGVEHTLENFYDSASLGLIAEYYKYETFEDDKYDDLELFQVMQNDLFLGLRYSFNSSDGSSIVGGVVEDSEYDERTYYLKYESRFINTFKVELDYYFIEPSKTENTAYALLGEHQRVALNLAYHF